MKLSFAPSVLPLEIPSLRRFLPLLLAGAFCLAMAVPAEAQTPRWEYRVVSAKLNLRPLEQMLNAEAAQGWELVQITDRGMAVFKRKAGR